MPHIPISDVFGVDATGKLSPDAKLLKLLPIFPTLKDAPLDQIPSSQVKADLTFDKPIDVSTSGLSLTLGASGGGSVALIDSRLGLLDSSDPFQAIKVKADEIYVALGLDFSASADVAVSAAPVTFGLSTSGGIEVRCYRRFQNSGAGFPPFARALSATASSFLFPREIADLDRIDSDTVVVIAGEGSLTVSGGVSVSLLTESLASADGDNKVAVKASGSISARASIKISGGYQVRLRRLDGRKIEIGVYTVKSREAALRVSASVGVSAAAGSFDLAEQFVKALSLQPAVDVTEFRNALPGEDSASRERQIDAFQSTLKAAIATKTQVSAAAAFSRLRSDEAAWTFEIDMDAAVSDQAGAAIAAAMKGDFTALTADPGDLPAGIAQKDNVLTRTELSKQTLNVNLLGVLNLVSIAKVTRLSTIERNSSGAITLVTDTSSASRLQALLLNAGVNARRLRKMLSENFLIEAAYHATSLGLLPPDFRSRHTYLEIHDSTGRQEMKDNLDVARILGLITRDEQNRRLSKDKFGRTTFYTEIKYSSRAVRRIFLDDAGSPRSIEEYETAGRSGLGALLAGDTGQEFRQRYADLGLAGTDLWNRMKKIGNVAAFAPLFGLPAGAMDPRVEAAGSDFVAITGWASAMNEAGAAIREVDDMLAGAPVDAGDARLTKARDHLKNRMAGVVSRTREHFGDPLGLIMVYVVSGQDGDRRVIASGDEIERLEVSSVPAPGIAQGASNVGNS